MPADIQNKSPRQDGEKNSVGVTGPRVVHSMGLKRLVSFKLCLWGTSELLNHNGLPRGPRFMVPEEGGMLIKFEQVQMWSGPQDYKDQHTLPLKHLTECFFSCNNSISFMALLSHVKPRHEDNELTPTLPTKATLKTSKKNEKEKMEGITGPFVLF